MQPKVILSLAWAEAEGMSNSDLASLLSIESAGAIPAGANDLCPRCGNHPNDSLIEFFEPDPATATPEQVKSRMIVKCLCRTTYWCAAVHEVDVHQLIGHARVHAVTAAPPVAPPAPMPSFVTDHVFQPRVFWQTWYGRYAREASRIFPPVR